MGSGLRVRRRRRGRSLRCGGRVGCWLLIYNGISDTLEMIGNDIRQDMVFDDDVETPTLLCSRYM